MTVFEDYYLSKFMDCTCGQITATPYQIHMTVLICIIITWNPCLCIEPYIQFVWTVITIYWHQYETLVQDNAMNNDQVWDCNSETVLTTKSDHTNSSDCNNKLT